MERAIWSSHHPPQQQQHHHHARLSATASDATSAKSSSSSSSAASATLSTSMTSVAASKSVPSSPQTQRTDESDLDAIKLLSLEEVTVAEHKSPSSQQQQQHRHKDRDREGRKSGSSGSVDKKIPSKAALLSSQSQATNSASGAVILPQGADQSIIRSGHIEFNTLNASNDVVTGPLTVNVCNAPNDSTLQCGCENINCPFCNLMLSIERTDPTVLQ